MKPELDTVITDRITLEKIRFGLQQSVGAELLEDMRYESREDIITQSIIKQITFYLWGNKVNEENHDDVVRIYPATMWEELKRDFWPNWLKRKFPIRYSKDIEHRTTKHYHVCPHLNYKDDHAHLRFLMLNDAYVDHSPTRD